MLGWDAAAMMPPGGAAARGDQLAVLAGLAHAQLTARAVADDLAEAGALAEAADSDWRDGQPPPDAACLHPRHRHAARSGGGAARANSACETVWREARRTADFALVRPHLDRGRPPGARGGGCAGARLGLSPYDALMDGYQPGIGAAEVQTDLRPLRSVAARSPAAGRGAPGQRARAGSAPRHVPRRHAGGAVPAACPPAPGWSSPMPGWTVPPTRSAAARPPTCGSRPATTRPTRRRPSWACCTRPATRCMNAACPTAYARQPVGEAAGMGAHESQSLIMEMQACRSDAYLPGSAPSCIAAFGGDPAAYEGANLARLWRRVKRGFIRVDADEMTYPAHIILRFRLEQALVAGELAVADLPGAWNDGLQTLLGITPPDDCAGLPAGYPLV